MTPEMRLLGPQSGGLQESQDLKDWNSQKLFGSIESTFRTLVFAQMQDASLID